MYEQHNMLNIGIDKKDLPLKNHWWLAAVATYSGSSTGQYLASQASASFFIPECTNKWTEITKGVAGVIGAKPMIPSKHCLLILVKLPWEHEPFCFSPFYNLSYIIT